MLTRESQHSDKRISVIDIHVVAGDSDDGVFFGKATKVVEVPAEAVGALLWAELSV